MKQLIHSNGSNESNERKLTFSCIAVELCKECTNHHETAKNTNGQNKQFEKSAHTPRSVCPRPIFSLGARGKTRVGRPNHCHVFEITVTFSEITCINYYRHFIS